MIRLLLDEHISPLVARALHETNQLFVQAMRDWHKGAYLGKSDESILVAAAAESTTLVTYDLRTIGPMIKNWVETNRTHGGVIFVNVRTIPPANIGAMVRALRRVQDEAQTTTWTNRVVFLQR